MEPTVVLHESAELGRLERVERGPDPSLSGIVKRYCGYCHSQTGVARRREVAQDQITIILGFGPTLRVSGATSDEQQLDSFVAPLHDSYAITEERDALRGIQIDLSPLGAHMLFGEAMHGLSTELVIPLADVLGERTISELIEQVLEAGEWPDRFRLLDEFIGRRVFAARQPSPDVAFAWQRLWQTGGQLPIADLVGELGCSNRHLVTRFREQIGLPPKTIARLLRFNRAIRRLERDDGRRFAEIAQTCGYYDQTHLNREFGQLAGTSPGEFVARLLPGRMGVEA